MLHYAAARGDTALAKVLLEYGADVNARDAAGGTPLHVVEHDGAVESRASKVAELPIARGGIDQGQEGYGLNDGYGGDERVVEVRTTVTSVRVDSGAGAAQPLVTAPPRTAPTTNHAHDGTERDATDREPLTPGTADVPASDVSAASRRATGSSDSRTGPARSTTKTTNTTTVTTTTKRDYWEWVCLTGVVLVAALLAFMWVRAARIKAKAKIQDYEFEIDAEKAEQPPADERTAEEGTGAAIEVVDEAGLGGDYEDV